MTSTKETYDYLVESHGIKTDVCKYCYNRDVEVFQDNWEGCYICWCIECEPKITPPPE